jgi:hypothetical protein
VYDRMRLRGFEAPALFVELRNGSDVVSAIDRLAASLA